MLIFHILPLYTSQIHLNTFYKFLLISSEELENVPAKQESTKNIFITLKYTLINSVYKINTAKNEYTLLSQQNNNSNKKLFGYKELIDKIFILIELIKMRFLEEITDRLTHSLFLRYLYIFFITEQSILDIYLLEETSVFLNIVLETANWIEELIHYSLKMIKNNPRLNTVEFTKSIRLFKNIL